MTHPTQVPEGWYPNPDGSPTMRYWNGSIWTEHLAPQADSTQEDSAPSQAAPATPDAQSKAKAPKKRIWDWKTWLTLLVCMGLIVAVSMWSKSTERENRAGTEGDAPEVLTTFLDGITANDESWKDVVTESYLEHLDDRKPVYGDPATAEVLDLTVDYTFGDIEYVRTHADYYPSNPLGSDLAQAVVHFTYEYTVLGETFTSTVQQAVFMTRPYYYDGSDLPAPADTEDERVPTAIGPWQVTNMRSPITISDDFDSLATVSDYQALPAHGSIRVPHHLSHFSGTFRVCPS